MTTAFLERPDTARIAGELAPLWDLDRVWAAFDGDPDVRHVPLVGHGADGPRRRPRVPAAAINGRDRAADPSPARDPAQRWPAAEAQPPSLERGEIAVDALRIGILRSMDDSGTGLATRAVDVVSWTRRATGFHGTTDGEHRARDRSCPETRAHPHQRSLRGVARLLRDRGDLAGVASTSGTTTSGCGPPPGRRLEGVRGASPRSPAGVARRVRPLPCRRRPSGSSASRGTSSTVDDLHAHDRRRRMPRSGASMAQMDWVAHRQGRSGDPVSEPLPWLLTNGRAATCRPRWAMGIWVRLAGRAARPGRADLRADRHASCWRWPIPKWRS